MVKFTKQEMFAYRWLPVVGGCFTVNANARIFFYNNKAELLKQAKIIMEREAREYNLSLEANQRFFVNDVFPGATHDDVSILEVVTSFADCGQKYMPMFIPMYYPEDEDGPQTWKEIITQVQP